MPTRSYYLQQAQSAFAMAAMSRDPLVRARWIERANEYQMLAQAMGEHAPPPPRTEQQLEQHTQRQQQIKPDKENDKK